MKICSKPSKLHIWRIGKHFASSLEPWRDKEVYMQLQNIQQQNVKRVEVHYECLLKLTNCLQVRTIDLFPTTIFKIGLLPYFILTTSMKWNTLIEHQEVVIVCEENGPISLNFNVSLTTPKVNVVVKPIVPIVIAKSTWSYTNCDKTCHILETCHNQK